MRVDCSHTATALQARHRLELATAYQELFPDLGIGLGKMASDCFAVQTAID
jgi:hypothetical protein